VNEGDHLQPLVREHLKIVLVRGLAPGLLIALLGLMVSIGPWSPMALVWADAVAARGNPDTAAVAYRLVAHIGVTEDIRERAAYRVAMAAAVDLEDPQRAIRALSAYIRQHPDGDGRGEALARLGGLFQGHLNAPERAARAWRLAAEQDADNPAAPEWLLRAAGVYESLEKHRQARELRDRVAQRYPEFAADAQFATARLLVERGETAEAYELYQQVASVTDDADLKALARLGMSICLEGDGDLQGALAELDEAADALPEDIWRRRRDAVRERQKAQQAFQQMHGQQ
jgi:tetratricopeptide (TPR) repeat protein